jgi:hypothetical protein
VLESLTPNTTRMKVTARQTGGFLTDSATATEVILQTEKLVGPRDNRRLNMKKQIHILAAAVVLALAPALQGAGSRRRPRVS